MGLNLKDIQLRLCKVIQVSIDTSYTFIQTHPLLSGASLVLFILYIFLSYIYSFLVYLSPFLFCTAILIRVFWSSEQTQLRYVRREEIKKREQKGNEQRYPKITKYERRDVVLEKRHKYSSQHALSRRRNFREKRWDVAGDIDEKSKALSTARNNRISHSSTEKKEFHSSRKGEGSSASAGNFGLRSEPSMRDLVEAGLAERNSRFDGVGASGLYTENMEDGDDEDEEEAQEYRNKAVEWTEDDQKNLMDLGISEMERNRRLESLIARRRARKLLKLQIENGLIDIKNVTPNQLAPLFISPKNPFDSPKDFDHIDGLEMPGSAPSVLPPSRNPFDLPYDPSEEKPILSGDSFDQEFAAGHLKDLTYCRHESFSLGPSFPVESKQDQGDREAYPFFNGRKASDKLGYPRFRRFPDKGNHDWLIEQLFSKGGHRMPPSGAKHEKGESEVKPPNPLRNKEVTKYEVGRENKKEIAEMKKGGEENALVTKSKLEDRSEPDLMKNSNYGFAEIGQQISNVEKGGVSEKLESRVHSLHSNYLNYPTPNSTTMHEPVFDSFQSPLVKNHENVYYAEKRLSHTPTCSIASDLQVEVSEIGSVDETNTTTDGESAVYDGDIDKDIITSGSEDMGGASFNSRAVHGLVEEDITDMGFAEVVKNLKDASHILSEQIDEANAADVSSGETPTYGINFGNIFGNVKKEAVVEIEEPQSLNSSDVSSPQKQLMDSSVDHPLHETHSENPEWAYPSENLTNEAKIVNDVNDSEAIENDDTENLQSIEDPGTSNVQQELVDEVSVNSSSSISPRSVLPENTLTDQISSSAFDHLIHADVPQSDTEDMTLSTSNGELPPEAMPQNMQSFMKDSTVQSHDGVLSNSQEASFPSEMADDASISNTFSEPIFDKPKMAVDPSTANILSKSVFDDVEENNISEIPPNKETADSPENSIEETNIFDKVNDVIVNDKEGKVKLKSDENNEDKSTSVIRQDAGVESPRLAEMTTLEDIDERSRELVDNKATIEHSKMTQENDNSTTTEDTKMSGSVTKDETILYHGNHVDDAEADVEAKQGVQVDFSNLTEHEEVYNPEKPEAKTDSINIPTIEEVPSNSLILESSLEVPKVNIENESRSVRQEATVEPFINAQVTSSSSAEDIEGKHDELNKNEARISPGSEVESNKLSKVAHTEQPEELAQLDDVNQPTGEKPNDRSEEMRYSQNESKELVEADIEKDEMASDSITKDLPQPIITEVSNLNSAEDTEGKPNEMNKKEAIKGELEKHEAMVSSGSVGEGDKMSNIAHTGEPDELVQLENVNLPKPVKANDRSEGEGYVQSESKKLVEDDKEKEKLATGDINKDSPQPTATSPIIFNAETNKGHAESS